MKTVDVYEYKGWRVRFLSEWIFDVSHMCRMSPMTVARNNKGMECHCGTLCPEPVWQQLMAVKNLLSR
jgi:hypothetical protein